MKRTYILGLFLMLLLGIGFNASALKVTLEWDTPGALKLQLGSLYGEFAELSEDQTSYTWETNSSYGYVYVFAADNNRLIGAKTEDGSKTFSVGGTPPRITLNLTSADDGKTVKIETAKLERNDTFSIDVVNGLVNILSAEFSSGYTLDLQKGQHTYNFNADYDDPLKISLTAIDAAYSITLNGEPIAKNQWYPRYENINVKSGDIIRIQVYENSADEPGECKLTVEYGSGMEGCISNIRDASSERWYYPEEMPDNSLTVLENSEIRVNFVKDDFNITKAYLNGKDISDSIITSTFDGTQSVTFTVTEENNIFKVDGTKKVYGAVDFTGYIINGEGVDFSLSYQGEPFSIPAGESVTEDIVVTPSLTMPASETKKYVIPISEKNAKFFFAPKKGYYISSLYTLTPEGIIEQHSGNSSMTADIDGTTFYMTVEKLPEEYNARLTIVGSDFNMRISSSSPSSSNWGNPSSPSYSTTPGEREISFIPGYGTPLVFGFSTDGNRNPALYLDGGEVQGTENSDSGAIEYYITPYSPSTDDSVPAGSQSVINVYNSASERPQMSGASLELGEGADAGFFYSPVLHKANPEGQAVISGTQFIVRPSSPEMVVIYKNEIMALDENGEFVFSATGNARNNIVKVVTAESADIKYELTPAPDSTVETLDEITISFPDAEKVEFTGEFYSFVLRSGGYFAVPGLNCEKDDSAKVPTFHLTIPEGVVTPVGDYSLIIEEGTFNVDGIPSPEIRASFTLDRESPTDYIVSPEKTIVYQDYGFDFAIVFDESTTVGWTFDYSKFHLSFDNTPLTPNTDYAMFSETNMLMFQVTNKEYLKEGHLVLEIDADAFKLGSTPSPAISAEWDVVAPKTFAVEVSTKNPADENGYVNDLSEIYVVFPEATSGEVFMGSAAFLHSRDYSYGQTAVISIDENYKPGVKVVLTFDPAPNKEGEYNLSMHTGAITLDGTFESPGVDESFLFDKESGICTAFADQNGNVTVFTTDGKVVLNNVPSDQLRNLENGIYIINGKKTIVK